MIYNYVTFTRSRRTTAR